MQNGWTSSSKALFFAPVLLLLAIILACGSTATSTAPPVATSAPAPTVAPPPAATSAPAAATASPAAVANPTPVPTAVATAAPAPTVAVPDAKPSGSLRIAYTEIGPPQFVGRNTGFPNSSINPTTIFETLWRGGPKGEIEPWLLKDWSISPDRLTWTLNLKEGIQFHDGWGELTAEDIKFNIEDVMSEGSIQGLGVRFKGFLAEEGAFIKVVDKFTLEVHTTSKPAELALALQWTMWSFGNSPVISIASKKYIESVGENKATLEGIGTSPWQFAEYRTGELFRMTAVENHWRKTPNFAELVLLEIPEVSTRVANFLAGQIDSMHMNPESLPAIESVEGVKFLRFPGAFQVWLNIHSQNYVDREGITRDANLPWISASSDVNSEEWQRARKVRQAMSIAIDRQLIVDELLLGEGEPASIHMFHGHDANLKDLKDLKYEFSVTRARQLLEEAGYGDGFDIDMALTFMPVPAVREVGEAVCVMWEELNIRCKQERLPMTAYRPNFVNRTAQGVNTHGAGTFIEPAWNMLVYSKTALINYGMEHPELEALTTKAVTTADTEERWDAQRAAAKWIFDNTVHIPVVQGNFIYPLGPRIDKWDLQCCFYSHLNNLEYVPHRQ